jgi:hypothetical protein
MKAWDEVERLGRNNKKIVDIKDHPVTRPIGLVNRVERFGKTAEEAAWRLRN